MMTTPKRRNQKFVVGFRPVVRARQGLMLGIRQPMDGPVFAKLEDARNWCIYAMVDHYDRRLGMSDASIEPFKGLVDCGAPPDPASVRDIERICDEMAKERAGE
jgi:hypothetical protein